MPSSACQTCALRSEEHTSELQSHDNLVCRLLLENTPPHTPRGQSTPHPTHTPPTPLPPRGGRRRGRARVRLRTRRRSARAAGGGVVFTRPPRPRRGSARRRTPRPIA